MFREIETIFDTECFVNNFSDTPKIGGVSIVGEMTSKYKRKFMKHMIENGTLEYF